MESDLVCDATIKYIQVNLEHSKKKPTKKETTREKKPCIRQQRVITETARWKDLKTKVDFYDTVFQLNCLNWLEHDGLVKLSLDTKIRGYKSQDVEKGIYDESQFVTYNYVINLLKEAQMKCFYCHCLVMVLYESIREPKQWTLERVDNKKGHNVGNVQISCLTCNLRRRTMFQERYLLTKQLANIQKIENT